MKPLLTEKTMRLAKAGQFTFAAGKRTKPAVARAVEKEYQVKVIRVNRSKNKAVVTLKSGQTIEAFSAKGGKK